LVAGGTVACGCGCGVVVGWLVGGRVSDQSIRDKEGSRERERECVCVCVYVTVIQICATDTRFLTEIRSHLYLGTEYQELRCRRTK
jgi:hypothetical protein